jgi:hypothetical protein
LEGFLFNDVRKENMESTNFTEQPQALDSEKQSLSSIHRSWGFPKDNELLWLLNQGVDENALWPISGATVCFDAGTFDLGDSGERALIFRAYDRDDVTHLIAWQPHTGTVASWQGQAFCLGDVDDVFNPATYFAGEALRLHATPLDWLLADREGIVIVRPDLAPAYLSQCQRIRCSNAAYARKLEQMLQPRRPLVGILVEVNERAAA